MSQQPTADTEINAAVHFTDCDRNAGNVNSCDCNISDYQHINKITFKDRSGDITLADIQVKKDIALDIKNDLIH